VTTAVVSAAVRAVVVWTGAVLNGGGGRFFFCGVTERCQEEVVEVDVSDVEAGELALTGFLEADGDRALGVVALAGEPAVQLFLQGGGDVDRDFPAVEVAGAVRRPRPGHWRFAGAVDGSVNGNHLLRIVG